MSPSQRQEKLVEIAVALVNTWDTMARRPEFLADVDALRRFLRHFGYDELADAARPRDVARVRAVRDGIRVAFEAHDEQQAVDALNRVAAEVGARPRLVHEDGSWRFDYRPDSGRDAAAVLGAESAIALLRVIRDDGWDRFGLCAAAPCCCVYVDRSRNRSRRYCCQLCADRMSQAAARARRRGRTRKTRSAVTASNAREEGEQA